MTDEDRARELACELVEKRRCFKGMDCSRTDRRLIEWCTPCLRTRQDQNHATGCIAQALRDARLETIERCRDACVADRETCIVCNLEPTDEGPCQGCLASARIEGAIRALAVTDEGEDGA